MDLRTKYVKEYGPQSRDKPSPIATANCDDLAIC